MPHVDTARIANFEEDLEERYVLGCRILSTAEKPNITAVAAQLKLPYHTLRNRFQGHTRPRKEAHVMRATSSLVLPRARPGLKPPAWARPDRAWAYYFQSPSPSPVGGLQALASGLGRGFHGKFTGPACVFFCRAANGIRPNMSVV
ncbi:hypothetical protein B0H10DRAFT_268748 [Mycena sp. CBHHK59/15]|nr:hypothetical protein B0H10DRAFT_268748 [Mycena sp. CBHHK59/15]